MPQHPTDGQEVSFEEVSSVLLKHNTRPDFQEKLLAVTRKLELPPFGKEFDACVV